MAHIAYLGSVGSFSSIAAEHMSSRDDTLVGHASFDEIFDTVHEGTADAAVVPVQNSIAGAVVRNYDLLLQHRLTITAEHYLPIEQSLIGLHSNVALADIREVVSHEKALAQCERFLTRHALLGWRTRETGDTAAAAYEVAEREDPSIAAIAHRGLAKTLGLAVLADGIQDSPDNRTRFVRIEQSPLDMQHLTEGSRHKYSLLLPDASAATESAVTQQINRTRHHITSVVKRPTDTASQAVFIDIVPADAGRDVASMLREISAYRPSVHLLGVYATSETVASAALSA